MTPEATKNAIRAIGYFVICIVTGLMVYQTPPTSWAQLGEWVWQPAMQGILAALTSLGLNVATHVDK
jgi:uncharacterized membrane protein